MKSFTIERKRAGFCFETSGNYRTMIEVFANEYYE